MHPQILGFRLRRATHRRRAFEQGHHRCLTRYLAREINGLLPPVRTRSRSSEMAEW
jgi:hypothetical protein